MLAARADVALQTVEAIESDEHDPSLSVLEALARGLGIPPAWLHAHPREFALLFEEPDEEDSSDDVTGVDPVLERILSAVGQERTLFVLLTTLLQTDDAKLVRAAEMSLRSLVKQSRQAIVPWQSRPSGHFEPPSD